MPPRSQGPNLGGLFGRTSGTVASFSYSKANKEKAMLAKKKKYDTQTSQAEAKKYLPPGCSIWRGLTRKTSYGIRGSFI